MSSVRWTLPSRTARVGRSGGPQAPAESPTAPATAAVCPTAVEHTEQAFYDLPVNYTVMKERAAAMSTPEEAGTTAIAETPAAPEPTKPRRGRPKRSTARATRTIELTLTVTGTADGDWQAELKQGNTWLNRGLPVSASAVSKAAQELHAELAGPINAVIDAAREQRAARVAALEAELEQARKALAEIEG